MNGVILAQALVELLQTAQGIAQTQARAKAENRDVSSVELDTHRQQVTDMRAKLLADLAAGT